VKTRFALAILAASLPALAAAKTPKAARDYPEGIAVGETPAGRVHVNRKRMTLYTLSVRWARARSGVGIEYCNEACLAAFAPLAADADAKPVGEWSVIAGPIGPQWAYKKNPVFAFNGDQRPGDTKGDGWDLLWSTLFYTPPKPQFVAPPAVAVTPVKGENVLTDPQGRALFLASGTGAGLSPFPAAMASRDIGEWTVLRDGDAPRWAWRKRPVFVGELASLPADAEVIKP
jgi:predicted lipoprotein with Yx(FWY)xxD motif